MTAPMHAAGAELLQKAASGERLSAPEIEALYHLPLPDVAAVAHELRLARTHPDVVTFLIDRNINYTNICNVGCNFCAFYRTRRQADSYTLDYDQISAKITELEEVGGTRILMQGGVNAELPLDYYTGLLRHIKAQHPSIKIDAFSPEEVLFMERAFGLSLDELLDTLIAAGLDGLPGAGGEILEDEVRKKAAPARIRSEDWFRIIDAAQRKGLYTISTMVIGFGESYAQRTRHLLQIREQQDRANALYGGNGFSGFAMWTLQTEHTRLHGRAPGATAHEYLQQLAIARIALDNVPNIQASWPGQGFKVAQASLYYGANDLGSTMMEENVVSAAGGHGRHKATVRELIRIAVDAGFTPAIRNSRFRIIEWPDVGAYLDRAATNPEAERAVGAAG
ncbi:dehypoxanthine futalosine cyclase [Deinococcus metallilatus]|uniref:Cyclic dehypoxanthine futalosine synthase n=1 Tax=Deinococcus metallilatus TaxID=1211322 RepID=A0AAJ5JXS6_9DEIO|nr:cyclic dehypoxanthinyl futalosine synthase [Deinococcus metallilatus]MBB5296258.1 dehypoxanthine futalosine cyclase [Deinococcus metallilatus]QBY09698.1 dehypoxanthine futalosine cyclase [Deinococcus metallilatus]RXJ08896.1 dehypoxanthine futalosine cyclase [Deinococcus metallilatus]TLK23725.1 dehypoxanthine futalosine cyclase [Deinococcus metallilatus]GMA14123.1 cyclic dehypoxanthine futalosine synthase [Deinococcus metallilatus]